MSLKHMYVEHIKITYLPVCMCDFCILYPRSQILFSRRTILI